MAKRKPKSPSLHSAAFSGDLDAVDAALGADAELHAEDKEGHTPLALAVLGGHLSVVERMLDVGADVTCRDGSGFNALHSCLMAAGIKTKDRLAILKLLVDAGADVNARSDLAGHPLEIVKYYRRSSKIRDYLVENGSTN